MKNIYTLATDKPSRIYLVKSNNRLGITSNNPEFTENFGSGTQNQHVYITSGQEIKDGEYYLYLEDNSVQKFIKREHTKLLRLDIQKKIILTTDAELIKDNVQAIDDGFLDWLVKNPSCESVAVGSSLKSSLNDGEKYCIMVPKEEVFLQSSIDGEAIWVWREKQKQHLINMMKSDEELGLYEEPKQETLEEACKRIEKELDYSEFDFTSFELGAKWQQEQDNKEAKILENILDDNYDLNVQFHKIKRECIYSFATAMYNEKLTFEEWEKKHYGNYVEQPKWQQERSYSEEDMIEASKYGYNFHKTTQFQNQEFEDSCIRNTQQWLTQFKKK